MFNDAFTVFPVLHTERLALRKLAEKDADSLNTCVCDPDWVQFTDYPPDCDFAKIIPLLNNEAYEAKAVLRWCIAQKSDDTCVGSIYLFFPHGDDTSGRRMEIGYEIVPAFRNKGYATEAIRQTVSYGFAEMGLVRIEALIMTGNTASMKTCEKAGFTKEGVLRKYRHYMYREPALHDMVIYSYLSGDARP